MRDKYGLRCVLEWSIWLSIVFDFDQRIGKCLTDVLLMIPNYDLTRLNAVLDLLE